MSKRFTMGATALTATLMSLPQTGFAQTAISAPAGASTERVQSRPGAGFEATGFSISIEEVTIAGAPAPSVPQRQIDRTLSALSLDVRYDGLLSDRRLAVATRDGRTGYAPGQVVIFRTASNYPAYLSRAEVVIRDRAARGQPVVARLPVDPNGEVSWTMPSGQSTQFAYVLEVRDAKGRRDETRAMTLERSNGGLSRSEPLARPDLATDTTARRGIPAGGGTISLSGSGGEPNGTVVVMGETLPLDSTGAFAVERILPSGDHIVTVQSGGRTLIRDVEIPDREIFGTGIVDLTLGRTSGGARDEGDGVSDARLAYYIKGKTVGGWTVTSSADTQEGPINELFSRFNSKDPDRVLDRLREESDLLYPTYGDDSTLFDDTPTQGNFYLRVENETSRLTFGNFVAGVTGPGLLQNTRELYGLEVRHASPDTTPEGDARFAITAYAAQPDTLPQRDILLATSGSIYFLSRRDISFGTVRISVQQRDGNTGFVTGTTELVEGRDFTVDHLQGVVILRAPVASFASDGTLIQQAAPDRTQALAIQYEYTPTGNVAEDVAWGGRAEVWATDQLRFGITAMSENTASGEDQMMTGLDAFLRIGSDSFVSLEVARTDGPGIARSISSDGGLTLASSNGLAGSGEALRFDSRFALSDLGLAQAGYFAIRGERLDAGFSTLIEDVIRDRSLLGFEGEIELNDRLAVSGAFERFREDGGVRRDEVEVALRYAVSDRLLVRAGLARLDGFDPTDPDDTGQRTDAAVRLDYVLTDNVTVGVFGQATLDRSGTIDEANRLGAAITARFGKAWTLSAEASGGDGGARAQSRLAWAPTPDNEVYLGYSLDPTRSDGLAFDDRGTLVAGSRARVSPTVATWTENTLDLPGGQKSLTRAYGIEWTPLPSWTLAGSVETGTVDDRTFGKFEREAFSFGASWSPSEDLFGRIRIEYGSDEGQTGVTGGDRETWGLTASYVNQLTPEWRLLANLEALISEAAAGDFRDGEFVRATVGYAYRPVENERLNILMGYSHLRDLPGPDQVTVAGGTNGPKQISDVLSLNMSYDLSRAFTLGAKLGYRSSEVATRGTDDFTEDRAIQTALRIDWHVVHNWDALVEGRLLRGIDAGSNEIGALAGVYRHVNENVKVGILYEFGGVSDDLTDIDYDSRGIMLNVIGKF